MDAMDNSAGVDLSDHEVNLKILMNHLSADGSIAGREQRNQLLGALADEVCASVLGHNRDQALSLSLDEARCRREPEPFLLIAERFCDMGLLDGRYAGIAARNDVLARSGRSLTRPELTILLAHAKLALKAALAEAEAVWRDNEDFEGLLLAYFPLHLRQAFAPQLASHPLAAEITASQVTNTVIDRAGASFLTWADGSEPESLARAALFYRLFQRVLEAQTLRDSVLAERRLSGPLVVECLLDLEDAVAGLCRWALAGVNPPQLDESAVARWCEDWSLYRQALEGDLSGTERNVLVRRADGLISAGLSPEVARALGWMRWTEAFPYIAELKRRSGRPISQCLQCYRRVARWMGWTEILDWFGAHPANDPVYRLAQRAIRERLLEMFARLSLGALGVAGRTPEVFLEGLRQQDRLANVGWIKRDLAGSAPSRALDMLIVLVAEASTAAEAGAIQHDQ